MILKKIILCLILTMTIFSINLKSESAVPFKISQYSNEEKVNISVYEKLNPAIVAITCDLGDGISSGTGCIINSNGVILTSSHVIEGAKEIEIKTSDEIKYNAEKLATIGENKDLALLKISSTKKFPIVALGNSQDVRIGQKVLAIGNPFGFNGTLTTGIISRIDSKRNKLQTDAAINPGSSGGPLLNAYGEVIGINQSIYNPDNDKSNIGIGFAVPINEAKKFIKLSNITIK